LPNGNQIVKEKTMEILRQILITIIGSGLIFIGFAILFLPEVKEKERAVANDSK
jgi:hypothetical protein